jgi:hypothetical protein
VSAVKIKVFESGGESYLQGKIDCFTKNNNIEVLDVKISCSFDQIICAIMYKELSEAK